MFQKIIRGKSSQDLKSISVISIGLLFVTRLDIIMVLLHYLLVLLIIPKQFLSHIYASTEWWNEVIMGWLHAILWVPHHIVALVGCFTFLILFQSIDDYSNSSWSYKFVLIILSALCCSSAVGVSIFVTFIFVISLSIWFLWSIFAKNYRHVIYLLSIVLTSFFIFIPFLQEITSASTLVASPLSLSVRIFTPAYVLANGFGVHNTISLNIINLVFLPLNYFLELELFRPLHFYIGKQIHHPIELPHQNICWK